MEQIINIDFLDVIENKEITQITLKVFEECFETESITNNNISTNVIYTNSDNIQKINKEFRKIDKATDVLSFPMFEAKEINRLINTNTPDILGDIIISIEQVKIQATEYGHAFERELAYMLVHGFYHLLGYDHMNEDDKKIMRSKEEIVLEKLKLTR